MNRRAFTLIELLVVIAIIAILAAILFPVFAQAKTAAKVISEMSNMKQVTTSEIMYTNDFDDVFPKGGTVNWSGWATGECDGTYGCLSWDKLAYPYMKSWELLNSPLDRSKGVPFPGGTIKRSFRAALNVFSGLGGINAAGTMYKPSKGGSDIPSPAATIMLTNQRNEILYSGTWWVYSTWYENWVWGVTSTNTRPNNPSYSTPNAYDSTTTALGGGNNYWGGVDISANGRSNYAFIDGHAKSHSKGYLFPGYVQKATGSLDVNPNFPGVCLYANQWSTSTATDCPVPQN